MSILKFVFDTETTGIPVWSKPSENEEQPHIVQLAALLVDIEAQNIVAAMSVIVKPEGWTIPQEVIDIHGITNEYASEVGISEHLALAMFFNIWNNRERIAHNVMFDNRIIRIGLKRYFSIEDVERWKAGDYECTARLSKPIMSSELGIEYNRKTPSLVDAYQHFIGQPLTNHHDAMADTNACLQIYQAIQKRVVASGSTS